MYLFVLLTFLCRHGNPYPTDVYQEVLKQFPHVITGVNLFHFYLCVHIAMIQEVDIGNFNLHMGKQNISLKNGHIGLFALP